MARLMSVAYTEQQVRARIKDVTRRVGWTFAKPGDRVILCRKVMGRQGAPLVRIVAVELLDVRREALELLTTHRDYGMREVEREGFPELNAETFIDRYFTQAQGVPPAAEVTRIEYRYCEDACLRCGLDTSAAWRSQAEWAESHYCASCWLREKRTR